MGHGIATARFAFQLYRDSWSVTHSPISQPDRRDAPGLIGELVPGVAAVIDDGVVGLDHLVGDLGSGLIWVARR